MSAKRTRLQLRSRAERGFCLLQTEAGSPRALGSQVLVPEQLHLIRKVRVCELTRGTKYEPVSCVELARCAARQEIKNPALSFGQRSDADAFGA